MHTLTAEIILCEQDSILYPEREIAMTKRRILVIGGDKRQFYLAQKAELEQNSVAVYGFDNYHSPDDDRIVKVKNLSESIREYDIILLPVPMINKNGEINMPLSQTSLFPEELEENDLSEKIIFGGKIPKNFALSAEKSGGRVYDYMEREELAVLNAVPTAEGALSVAMNECVTTLFGSKCLVVGYGRIGKVLSRYLSALGCSVTVSARRYSDLAYIKSNSMTAVRTNDISASLSDFDIIFNTVPFLIFTENRLRNLKKDALLIDLASAPGGIDLDAAKQLGIKTRIALGLPGKVAPKSSGEIIWDTVKNIIEEENL